MFSISAGPLPKEDALSLPAAQTSSDGKVVNWNEKAAQGQPEPEHPAPTLKLTAAPDESPQPQVTATQQASSALASSTPAWPGISALVLAIVAVLLGIANLALVLRKS